MGMHAVAASLLTSGPNIVAFQTYKLSSDTGLAEHLQETATAAAAGQEQQLQCRSTNSLNSPPNSDVFQHQQRLRCSLTPQEAPA